MGVEVLVPTGLFAMVVLIVFIAVNGGIQKRKAILATVQEAIRAGQQMTPETIRALGVPQENSNADLKAGLILIAVAVAVVAFGWAIGAVFDEDNDGWFRIFLGMSAFPGFIGLVLLGFGLLGSKKTN